MPLNELETFISKHSHLPEVPSEKEVKTDGQNIGELNGLLLKKIEELTLYIIEQNKRLENQEKRIIELEKGK